MNLRQRIIDWAAARPANFIIGGKEDPYLLRWFLIPRNPVFNVYVHLFMRSDDDRALHTHPWAFNCSILLDGQYLEHTQDGAHERQAGDWKFRWGAAPHRVELPSAPVGNAMAYSPCWTATATPTTCPEPRCSRSCWRSGVWISTGKQFLFAALRETTRTHPASLGTDDMSSVFCAHQPHAAQASGGATVRRESRPCLYGWTQGALGDIA